MKKGMNNIEFFYALMLFFAGGITIIGKTSPLRDDWLVHLLQPVFSLPLCLIYISLAKRGRAGDCMRLAYGRIAGVGLSLCLCVVALLVSACVINIYVDYVSATPMVMINRWFAAGTLGALCYAIAVRSQSVIARMCRLLFPLMAAMLAVVLVISVKYADIGNLLPIGELGAGAIARDMWKLLLLQTAPAFFFILQAGPGAENPKWPRAALLAVLCIAVLIGLNRIKNLAVIGWPLVAEFRFPSSAASSVLDVGEFFRRFEFLTSIGIVLCQPISAAISLRFAEKSLTSVFPMLSPKLCTAAMAVCVTLVSVLPLQGWTIALQPWYSKILAIALVALPAFTLAAIMLGERVKKAG